MRVEIHRTKLITAASEDGTIAVAYDVLVPVSDCVPGNSANLYVEVDHREYMAYPQATWATDLEPGWERLEAWFIHEKAAHRRMLEFLHRHCPETRDLNEWPTLWAHVDPKIAGNLDTIRFTIPSTQIPRAA